MIRKILYGDIEERLITIEVVLDSLIKVLDEQEVISRGQVQVEILRQEVDDE